MKVKDIISQPPVTCNTWTTLQDAAGLMWDHDCGVLPVVDQDDRVVGMLTDRDICMTAYSRGTALHDISVEEAMSRDVVTCGPDDNLEAAEDLMRTQKVRRLPIISEDGRLEGVLSLNDIALACVGKGPKRAPVKQRSELVNTLAGICEPGGPHLVSNH